MKKLWMGHVVRCLPYGIKKVEDGVFCFFDRRYNNGETFKAREADIANVLRKSVTDGLVRYYFCDVGTSPIYSKACEEDYFRKLGQIMRIKLNSKENERHISLWGAGSTEDVKINQYRFMEEHGIKGRGRCQNVYAYFDGGSNMDSIVDHPRDFSTNDKKFIIVLSPYLDGERIDSQAECFGFTKTYPLHVSDYHSYYGIFDSLTDAKKKLKDGLVKWRDRENIEKMLKEIAAPR
jgi:hypothetical protein